MGADELTHAHIGLGTTTVDQSQATTVFRFLDREGGLPDGMPIPTELLWAHELSLVQKFATLQNSQCQIVIGPAYAEVEVGIGLCGMQLNLAPEVLIVESPEHLSCLHLVAQPNRTVLKKAGQRRHQERRLLVFNHAPPQHDHGGVGRVLRPADLDVAASKAKQSKTL